MTFISPLGPLEEVWGNPGGRTAGKQWYRIWHLLVSMGSVGMLVRHDSGMAQGCSSSLATDTQTCQHICMENSTSFRVRLTCVQILEIPYISCVPLVKWLYLKSLSCIIWELGLKVLSHTNTVLQWGCTFTEQWEGPWHSLCIHKVQASFHAKGITDLQSPIKSRAVVSSLSLLHGIQHGILDGIQNNIFWKGSHLILMIGYEI